MILMNLPPFLQYEDNSDFIRITGHRIGLAEVVRLYNRGSSAEMIASHFPTLSLAEIYSVLAYYLQNQGDVDKYAAEDLKELTAQEAKAGSGGPTPTLEELRRRFNVLKKSGS
jgi:uncharacterized protein (DUF433 family)